MKFQIRQFFTEANGRLSMTRLLSFILVTGGLTLCFIYPDKPVGEIVIALGLGAKVGQKPLERKIISDESKTITPE